MKDQSTKEKFIELRAEGKSYDSIASIIKVSKPTQIKWQREFSSEISNLKYMRIEEVLEKYKLSKLAKIEFLAKQLEKISTSIDEINFAELKPREIILLREKIVNELSDELNSIEFFTGETKNSLDKLIDYSFEEIRIPLDL